MASIDSHNPWASPQAPQRPSPLLPFLLFAILVLAGLVLFTLLRRNGDRRDPSVDARPVAARGDLAEDEKTTIAIFEEASPSVVHVANIQVLGNGFTMDPYEREKGTGTGFIWNRDGYIVTNYHVVKGGGKFVATLYDQTQVEAVFVGGSRAHDLAVLRVSAPEEQLKPILIGRSGNLRVGQKVFAIGNPFGLDQTLSTGVVSQLNRVIATEEGTTIRGVIQTDAAINPGNSGGPLLDSAGRLIGVNTAIVSPSGGSAGIGFAVPVDVVNQVIPQIIAHGLIQIPSLQADFLPNDATQMLIERRQIRGGVPVLRVDLGGAAHTAGIRGIQRGLRGDYLGDIILEINGTRVSSSEAIEKLLMKKKVGDKVDVLVERAGKTRRLDIVLRGEG